MLEHRADHTGHGSDGFEDNGAVAIAFGKKCIGAETKKFGKAQRETVRKIVGRIMDHGLRVVLVIKCFFIGLQNRIGHRIGPFWTRIRQANLSMIDMGANYRKFKTAIASPRSL